MISIGRGGAASTNQPFKTPSINQDRAICWREKTVQVEQLFLLPGGLWLETSKHLFLGSGGTNGWK